MKLAADPLPSTRSVRPKPRVAIVSDALVQRGGAERVVEAMAEAFPEAPILALLYCPVAGPSSIAPRVTATWLKRIPGATRRHRALLPLYPAAIESIDLRGYDVVLSSHHTVAKGVLRSGDQVHVSYCHTPMRALWERTHDELETLPRIIRPPTALVLSRLRAWDLLTTGRVDKFLANSATTQRRIAKHWGRSSDVLYPPIDVQRFTPEGSAGDYYLIACRAVPYKRNDIAIAAARRIGRRVIVVGGLRRYERLEGVEHRGHVTDDELLHLMRGARALLFPQNEDFGMTVLEVNACGRPVVAFAGGGALETVVEGVTGILACEQTVDSFAAAMLQSEAQSYAPIRIREHAEQFAKPKFISRLREIIDAEWNEHQMSLTGDGTKQRLIQTPVGTRRAEENLVDAFAVKS